MILIDTGPLVALCDARDSHHRLAVTQIAGLGTRLATCEAVLMEAGFHLPTYDAEFRTIWRRPDGTRIPLAVRV
jgi:predicted nucleic acid-binding protein